MQPLILMDMETRDMDMVDVDMVDIPKSRTFLAPYGLVIIDQITIIFLQCLCRWVKWMFCVSKLTQTVLNMSGFKSLKMSRK